MCIMNTRRGCYSASNFFYPRARVQLYHICLFSHLQSYNNVRTVVSMIPDNLYAISDHFAISWYELIFYTIADFYI